MLLGGALTAFLLISGVSAVIAVPPPTNVSVSCQNVKVTVSWEYSQQQPQTSFIVQMRGSAGIMDYKDYRHETTNHQYDLSYLVWSPGERYMDFLYVTVAAKQGNNLSEEVKSKTFSFNELKTTDITCKLNFPPVDLTVEGSRARVNFRNPLHHYSELKRAVNPDTALFKFIVSSGGVDFEECTVTRKTCICDVVFPKDDKCVTLTGWLTRNDVGRVFFNKTERICASDSAGVHVITLIILMSVIGFVFSVVTIIICKARAWTMDILPTALLLPEREQDLKYCPVFNTPIDTVGLNKPVSSEEEKNVQDSSSGIDLHASVGLYMERQLLESRKQELEAERLVPEGHRVDDDSADDSVKTECVSIDLEEEEVSPYDRPQTLQLDMGDGDMITGYTGR